MLLETISPFISIDKIITKDSHNYIHFITHLNQSFVVPNDWQSIIYTSKHIAELLAIKQIVIPMKYFKILKSNEINYVYTRNGAMVLVRMFESDSLRRNVLFHFEYATVKIVYSGPLLESRSILLNDRFRECVQSRIDELYVDNTRAHSTHNETVQSAAEAIRKVAKDYPDHIMLLNAPAFGYEDLIYTLAKNYEMKVFAGPLIDQVFKRQNIENLFTSDLKSAKIVIGEGYTTLENLKRRYSRKQLTIHFVESNLELKNLFREYGLIEMHYSPHPSLFELYSLISFVKPSNVHGIYKDMPQLPSCLKCLCNNKNSIENASVHNRYQSSCNEEVENIDLYRNERDEDYPILPLSGKSKNKIELPRKVVCSQRKRNDYGLISNIAIIKPNTMQNHALATSMQEDKEEEGNYDSGPEIFDKPLSYLSLSDSSLESLSSIDDHSVDDAEACNIEDVRDIEDVVQHAEVKCVQEVAVTPLMELKRRHPNARIIPMGKVSTINSGQFVERRYKSKVFSGQPTTIRYASDESS